MSNIESSAVTSKHLPPIWDSQGPTDLLEKAISCSKNRNSTNKIDNLPKKDSNGIKKYKSASEELAEKRLRIVQKFRREEEGKFDEQDKGKTGRLRQLNQSRSHSKSSRNNPFTKRRPKPNPTSDPDHICSSSCPANHWMSDDEGWIEKDVVSDDEDTQWFPDFQATVLLQLKVVMMENVSLEVHRTPKKTEAFPKGEKCEEKKVQT